jgi:ATP-binding protein involved in chromosome partitioning
MTTIAPMSDLAAAVRTALRAVIDPDLHQDLVTLNMVRDVVVEDGVARLRLVLTTGACPVKQQLEDQCRAACLSVDGVRAAQIAVSAEVPPGRSGQAAVPGVRHVVGVGSGKGGVGKSTLTVNLACALAGSGARVGVLDADIYGPSVPTMMGVHRQPFVIERKMVPLESHGVKFISMGLLIESRQAVVLRGPMVGKAVQQLLTDVSWGELDYLLVDLPPGTGDVQLTLCQTVALAGAVVVSTPQAVALADARRCVAMFEKVKVPIFGVVENMSEFVCPACGHHEAIFGHGGAEAEARELKVPFLGSVPLEPAVRAAGDDGTPVVLSHPGSASAVSFRAIAAQLASRISMAALSGQG